MDTQQMNENLGVLAESKEVVGIGDAINATLAGASLTTSFAIMTGFSLLAGMGSALDTLCGQAYGAANHHMLGICMQRGMIVSLLIKFLQAQNNVKPMMFTTGIILLLHVLSCWILLFKTDLGSRGAALANATSYWINMLLLAAYIKVSPSCKSTWTGFSREAFSGIPRYLRLAVPSTLMICLNTSAVFHMLSEGLGAATSVRVSNELGAGQQKSARLAAQTATVLATIEGTLIAVLMISIRKVWVTGVARGCGWQKKAVFVNLGAHYLFGVPSGNESSRKDIFIIEPAFEKVVHCKTSNYVIANTMLKLKLDMVKITIG
ncbi:putative vinorine synthase-like [Capsicum annuum]|nr:putative vinorine synthase-like [Capsicum annuum]